jgi:hypothetical protein
MNAGAKTLLTIPRPALSYLKVALSVKPSAFNI